MVAGGLTAIFFVCTLVVWTVWTGIYGIFAAHYFLVTLTDSSSGQDEAQYPNESVFDWWWKPILCGWVLLMWLIPVTLLLMPLALVSPQAFGIVWALVLWLLFPLGIASALYTQNWLHIIHAGVIGPMFRHLPAFVYVYLLTFGMFVGTVWIINRALTDSLIWMVPAVVCLPAVLLLYARHWGRFAWLSLNHLPRTTRRPRAEAPEKTWAEPEHDEAPKVEPAEPAPDGIRAGLPPATATAIQATASSAPAAEEVDEWTDTKPYTVIQDASLPSFQEAPEEPLLASIAPPAPPPPVVEEEDEWALDKKPYAYTEPDPVPESAPATATKTKPDPNKPITLTKYYDDRAKKEKKAQRKAEEAKRAMPTLSNKTPTFHAALIAGVWKFMFYTSTLQIWGNLLVLTIIELFIMYMLVQFWPKA